MKKNSPPSEDTKQKIIQAASALFAEKGFAGTTTRSIAELAEVNEVTIFRHFGTKDNLAKTIMDQYGGPAIAKDIEKRFSGDYIQDITMIGQIMMKIMTERNDAIRMAICEAGNFPEFQEVAAENPRQLRRMLARYLQSQMDVGVIHPGHAEIMAQAFLGMFFSYVVLEGFLSDTLQPEVSPKQVAEQFTALFIRSTFISGASDG
jgi:AcrR family transcriptional regulator